MELEIDNSFETFWELYPRKQDKQNAQIKFEKLSDAERFNAINGARHHAKNNSQWKNPKMVPLPTTFINGKRWLDEITLDTQEKIVQSQADSPAAMVWSAMTQLYGEAWIKKFGPEPTEVWRKMLIGIPNDRIKRGLRACVESGSDFPPSLPKFLEYCAERFGENDQQKLPKPIADTEMALASIEKMKEILGV
jgi:hypothetical protein